MFILASIFFLFVRSSQLLSDCEACESTFASLPCLSQQIRHTRKPLQLQFHTVIILSHRKGVFLKGEENSLLHFSSSFFFFGQGSGDPISPHLLILKSKLVPMRTWEECVSLTFFVECICTSCSSNLRLPSASLIKSSP